MKTKTLLIFIFNALLLVSCTVESPDFVVQGVRTNEALLFMKKFHKGEKSQIQFWHYVKHLRTNHVPGFSWEQYWSGIKKNQLYKNLTPWELSQLFSLKEISCRPENGIAFSELLLQITHSDPKKMILESQLTRQLNHLQRVCSTRLPDSVFKSIALFLSEKRSEKEIQKLKKAKNQLKKQNRQKKQINIQKNSFS